MQTAEIIEGLRGTLSRTTPPQYKRALQAAIAALEPVPITEDRLREAGFRRHDTPFGDNWVLRLQDDLDIIFFRGHWVLAEFEGGEYDLNIPDMQTLLTVIEALGGAT